MRSSSHTALSSLAPGGSRPKSGTRSCAARVMDPSAMQNVLVGSAVSAACCSALFNGLKDKDVALCDLCAGNGGSRCFVCEGSGKRSEVTREMLAQSGKKQFGNPRECKPCLGSGLIPCSKCKGKGFLNGL